MNKTLKLAIKSVITLSSMVACNEFVAYHANPYKSATGTRLACNVAGYSCGFFIGTKVGSYVVEQIEDAIKAYKGEGEDLNG